MNALKVVLVWLVMMIAPAMAAEPDEVLSDPILEERARELGRELRCITCQSQSIEDSDAPLAKDLRLIVREQIVQGATDREITDYLTDRYGDYIRMRPRLSMGTALLWFAPIFVLGFGGGIAFVMFRNMRRMEDALANDHEKTSPEFGEKTDPDRAREIDHEEHS